MLGYFKEYDFVLNKRLCNKKSGFQKILYKTVPSLYFMLVRNVFILQFIIYLHFNFKRAPCGNVIYLCVFTAVFYLFSIKVACHALKLDSGIDRGTEKNSLARPEAAKLWHREMHFDAVMKMLR